MMVVGYLVWFGLLSISIEATPTPPYNLQCEHNFVGIPKSQLKDLPYLHHFTTDNPNPLLSWTIDHSNRGAFQKAFRVQVSRGYSLSLVIWDSGAVPGDQTQIRYQGPFLTQGEVYLWNVTWWDHNGIPSSSEEVGHFLSAVNTDWGNVSWIAANNNSENGAQTFVKQIDLTGKMVRKAVLYISGLGLYRAYVNGFDLHQLSDPPIFFLPGWTNYAFRIGYQAFEVTNYVMENLKTELKVTLAKGYRDMSAFKVKDPPQSNEAPDSVERVLRAQFKIEFSDGSEEMVIKSDDSWDVYNSKYAKTSIYNGEYYNATIPEINTGKAVTVNGPAGIMYLPNIPNIVEIGYDTPINISDLYTGSFLIQIIDFGVNTAGVVNISVGELPAGHQIIIHHAEVLMHMPYGTHDGSLYTSNLRSAAQLDTYISNGTEKFYQPKFTYHGFRYVSVTNYPRRLTQQDLKRVRVSTKLRPNSHFNTSIDLLNQLQDNCVTSHTSNLMTIPTDCDQRDERLGWMGDNGLSADAMALNFHMQSYFPHRIMIIEDDDFNGSIPEITPWYRYGRRPAETSWAGAYIQLVWVLMEQYGDIDIAKKHFNRMYEYIDYTLNNFPKPLIRGITGPNGDWCQPFEYKKVSNNFTSGFSFMLSVQELLNIAKQIGNSYDANLLEDVYKTARGEFDRAFKKNISSYLDDVQSSYALPMYLDKDPINPLMTARLINIIAQRCDMHLSTGIIGTKAILPVLTKIDHTNLAIQLITGFTYPSYGYMIHNPYEPATALWELWNSFNASARMSSRNHHMFSSVSGWMQTDMIGFQQVKGTYGYREMDLNPASCLDLSAASIKLEYPKPIRYWWRRNGGLQCGKAAEDRSSRNPGLPKHNGLEIKCGEGVITKVMFASYGNPEGVCGYHRYGDCHASYSVEVVEKMCLNKPECRVQTDGDFWGDPCPGRVNVKWLTVAVQCGAGGSSSVGNEVSNQRYSSLSVGVSVPIQSTAHLNIPAYGLGNLEVWDANTLVYSGNKLLVSDSTVAGIRNGIQSASWIPERDVLRLDLISGDYSFTVRGQSPNETHTVIVEGTAAVTMDTPPPRRSHGLLECSNMGNTISRIDWVSYGDPIIDEYGNPSLGQYHSHASRMIVENACLGKRKCIVPMDKDLFFAGSEENGVVGNGWRFISVFFCNHRA